MHDRTNESTADRPNGHHMHLEEHQARPRRQAALAEFCERRSSIQHECLADEWRCRPDRLAIGSRCGHEKDDLLDRIVALLQGDPPGERLEVRDACLSLDSAPAVGRVEEHGVPGSLVPFDPKRDFDAHPEVAMQSLSEPVQEGNVSDIADRASAGIGSDAQVETDDTADPGQVRHRDVGLDGTLDPTDLAV